MNFGWRHRGEQIHALRRASVLIEPAANGAERLCGMREIVPAVAPPIGIPAVLASPPRIAGPPRVSLRRLAQFVLMIAVAIGGMAAGRWWMLARVDPGPAPTVVRLGLYARLADLTPITITVGGARQAPWSTTVDQLRRDYTLWRMMHLQNWDNVPTPLREEVLERVLARYRPLLMNPRVWDGMTATDWDDVPQPVRTVAYRQMSAYWAGFYDVGAGYELDRRDVRDTLQAIAMSESWLDHRALRVDFTGNHDVGLVQASDYARERVRQLAQRGVVDVSFTDDDYWNPWKATRFLAIWMSLLLEETHGDLSRAVRAYNRGIGNADDAAGQAYLAGVERRRRRFVQNQGAPPAWTWLSRRARQIEAEEWPWLSSP
jgi:hypothetical protein